MSVLRTADLSALPFRPSQPPCRRVPRPRAASSRRTIGRRLPGATANRTEPLDSVPSRRFFLKSLVGSAAALLATGAYAFGIEPAFRLRVQRYALVPRGWPAGLNLRLAVLADLHAGEPYMPVSRVEEIVAAANGLGADVIVVLGDYLAGHRFMTRQVGMTEITPALAQLKAPLGVFSILGNHDWWDDQVAQRERKGPIVAARALR